MANKTKITKRTGQFFSRQIFRLFKALVWVVPPRIGLVLGYVLSQFAIHCVPTVRKRVMQNLILIWGGKKKLSELRKIAQDFAYHMVQMGMETIWAIKNPELISSRLTLQGEKNLKQALSRKKGVLLLTGHLGPFTLLASRQANGGYPTAMLIRQMADRKVEKDFQELRDQLGINTIVSYPRAEGVRNALRWLRQGGILAILIDQRFKTGVFVDFLGRKCYTPTGLATFAMRTGAPVIPAFIVRTGIMKYQLIFGEEIPVVFPQLRYDASAKDRALTENMQRFNNVLGKYVERYPEQWFWLHRRWKT